MIELLLIQAIVPCLEPISKKNPKIQKSVHSDSRLLPFVLYGYLLNQCNGIYPCLCHFACCTEFNYSLWYFFTLPLIQSALLLNRFVHTLGYLYLLCVKSWVERSTCSSTISYSRKTVVKIIMSFLSFMHILTHPLHKLIVNFLSSARLSGAFKVHFT